MISNMFSTSNFVSMLENLIYTSIVIIYNFFNLHHAISLN